MSVPRSAYRFPGLIYAQPRVRKDWEGKNRKSICYFVTDGTNYHRPPDGWLTNDEMARRRVEAGRLEELLLLLAISR